MSNGINVAGPSFVEPSIPKRDDGMQRPERRGLDLRQCSRVSLPHHPTRFCLRGATSSKRYAGRLLI